MLDLPPPPRMRWRQKWSFRLGFHYTLVNQHSWLENGPGLSRCISYWRWGYSSQAMLVDQRVNHCLGGGNSNIFGLFTPIWGRFPISRSYFLQGLVQPPTSCSFRGIHQLPSAVSRLNYTEVCWVMFLFRPTSEEVEIFPFSLGRRFVVKKG